MKARTWLWNWKRTLKSKLKSKGGEQAQAVKHVPQRTCVACREVKPKRQLIRIVYTSDGRVEMDPTGKRAGRGAYVCGSPDCWEKGLKKGRLEHVLRGPVSSEDWARLQEYGKTLCPDESGDSI